MTLTVRLDAQLEDALNRYCRRRRKTKSEVLTALLREHLAATAGKTKTPYAIARELGLVGGFSSAAGDLSETYKRRLKQKLRARRAR